MRKFAIPLSGLMLCAIQGFAEIVTASEAYEVARDFISEKWRRAPSLKKTLRLPAATTPVLTQKNAEGTPWFYVFNAQKGYVIVAADTRVKSIIGYSTTGHFSSRQIPEGLQAWLNYCGKQIDFALQQPDGRRSVAAAGVTSAEQSSFRSENSSAKSVSPLMKGYTFGQEDPYNRLCPLDGDRRSATGCVATATAQIMRYHQWPAKGEGAHSYTSAARSFPLSANFGETHYDWTKIRTSYLNSYSSDEANEVAKLLFHVGVSVDMNYTADGSGSQSYPAALALKNYFGYSPNMQYLQHRYFSEQEWIDILKNELRAGRPVYYDGRDEEFAHAFVCEGFDERDMFYFNWGWNGDYNGYYALNLLTPRYLNFHQDQSVILGITPNTNVLPNVSYLVLSEYKNKLLPNGNVETSMFFFPTSLSGFQGKIAPALYNLNGDLVKRFSSFETTARPTAQKYAPEFTSHKYLFELSELSEIEDGTYQLVWEYANASNAKWTVMAAPADYPAKTNIKIAAHHFTEDILTGPPAVLEKQVEADPSVGTGDSILYRATLVNNGRKFEGRMVLSILNLDEEGGEYHLSGDEQKVTIEERATITYTFKGLAPNKPGHYRLQLMAAKPNEEFSVLTEAIGHQFTVVPSTKKREIDIDAPRSITANDNLTYRSTFINGDTRFQGKIALMIRKLDKPNAKAELWGKPIEVSLEAGDTIHVEFTGLAPQEAGGSQFLLAIAEDGTNFKPLGGQSNYLFDVVLPPGIREIAVEAPTQVEKSQLITYVTTLVNGSQEFDGHAAIIVHNLTDGTMDYWGTPQHLSLSAGENIKLSFSANAPQEEGTYRLEVFVSTDELNYQKLVQSTGANLSVGTIVGIENIDHAPLRYHDRKITIGNVQQPIAVVVSDLSGKVIFEQEVASRQTITLENLSKGIYLLKVNKATHKIVVE